MTLKNKRAILALFMVVLAAVLASAANDPGHDTLYIEEQGDSELNGTLNVTQNISVEGGRTAVQGILLYGDGTTPASGNPYVGVNADDMYLYAADRIILKYPSGGGAVYIGHNTNTPTDLNVSGALYLQGNLTVSGTNVTIDGENVCLENGTNCPPGVGGVNVSSVDTQPGAPDNLVISPTDGDVRINLSLPTCGGSDVLTYNGTNITCAAGGGGGGNVTGSGTAGTFALWNNTDSINSSIMTQSGTNVSIAGNISMPAAFWIGENAKATGMDSLAIGRQAKAEEMYALAIGRYPNASGMYAIAIGDLTKATNSDSIAIGRDARSNASQGIAIGLEATAESGQGVAIGPGANASGQYAIVIGNYADAIHQNSVALGRSALTTASEQFMIGTATYNLNMRLHGSINASGRIYEENGSRVCTPDNGLCPSGTGGSGNITGNGTAGYLALWNTTENINASAVYQHATTGFIGINTSGPSSMLSVNGNVNITGRLFVGDSSFGNVTPIAVFADGIGKIDVGVIDPVYTIGEKSYSTYVSAMTGMKEETTGTAEMRCTWKTGEENALCTYTVSFRKLPEGSDLWLFSKTTDLEENFDAMSVLPAIGFDGRVWYEKDLENLKVTFYAERYGGYGTELSYRLTAPRFDHETWKNENSDNVKGYVIGP